MFFKSFSLIDETKVAHFTAWLRRVPKEIQSRLYRPLDSWQWGMWRLKTLEKSKPSRVNTRSSLDTQTAEDGWIISRFSGSFVSRLEFCSQIFAIHDEELLGIVNWKSHMFRISPLNDAWCLIHPFQVMQSRACRETHFALQGLALVTRLHLSHHAAIELIKSSLLNHLLICITR